MIYEQCMQEHFVLTALLCNATTQSALHRAVSPEESNKLLQANLTHLHILYIRKLKFIIMACAPPWQ